MAVFSRNARSRADRIAALVAGLAFLIGIVAMVLGNSPSAVAPPTAVSTTVVSSDVPGPDVTETSQHTSPPSRPTNPPTIIQDTTVTSGSGGSSVVVTTTPAVESQPFLGSRVANIVFQLLLVTLASLFLGFAVHRILLGEYGVRAAAAGAGSAAAPAIEVDEAAAVKRDVAAAPETADLSRPLYEKGGITDARLRLLQSRIALELEVRKLAQNHDLPSGLTIPYVIAGLVEKKAMTDQLAAGVTALSSIGDRLGLGADLSTDASTLLGDSYAQALAKVGGKIKK